MEIQRLTVEDVERFRAIRLRALRDAPSAFGTTFEDASTWPPEVWSKLLGGIAAFVAVVDDEDVGLVRGGPDGRGRGAARLGSLWVRPEARGIGVGASLIDAVVAWARFGGFVELHLGVSDDGGSAIELYSRKGFVSSGEVGTLPPPRQHLRKHERVLEL